MLPDPVFAYPVFLDLHDVPVLVVGAGPVALRKVEGLVDAGALVTVVAPDVASGFAALAITVRQRVYVSTDIDGHRLVITATSDTAVNAQVSAEATAAGVWVNSADDPQNCSFILPAIARRGAVTVAISTGGASPALARRLRDDVADLVLTEQVEAAAIDLARQRADVHAAGASTEHIDWTDRVQQALRPDQPSAGRESTPATG